MRDHVKDFFTLRIVGKVSFNEGNSHAVSILVVVRLVAPLFNRSVAAHGGEFIIFAKERARAVVMPA